MLQRKTQHATRERMLREMAEAVDVLTAEQPLIVWLEDLHWSDPSTLELLALLARRRELARFLVIGTYRPVDVIVSEHPLKAVKQELQLHGQCQEVAVRLLSEEAVGKYLTARFEADRGARHAVRLQQLAHTIHQRTEGNPLFMVNIVEELSAQGKIDSTAVELITLATIREMIERHLERLSPAEQRILEVASVAGIEFSTAAVAAGTEITVDEVEQQCAALARRGQFLRSDGQDEWPDGTIATRYSFLHALYQEVTYERVPVGWRTRLHQRIGERYEAAYGKRVSEIAAELAVHFKRGQDYSRAVRYLRQAGQNAARRSAHQEAITLLTKGLELLNTFPDTPERARQELRLLRLLGPALVALRGYTAPEVEQTYARAFALCQQDGRPHQLLQVLPIFRVFSLARGEAGKAREVAEQVLQLAQQVSTPTALLAAHYGLGESLFHLGEFTAAREHLEQTWRLYNPQEHNPHVTLDWGDSGVWCLSHLAATLWMLGYPDQAWQRIDESLALAKELAHPFSLVFAVAEAGALHLLHQEWQHVRERAEEVMQLATEHGFPFLVAHGTALRGLALVAQGQGEDGIAQIQQSLASFRAMGTEMSRVDGLPWLAEAYGKVGQVEEGLTVLAEALAIVKKNGERWWGAELYRLKGELLLNAERGMRNAERKTKKKG
jgi:predicted ATPase